MKAVQLSAGIPLVVAKALGEGEAAAMAAFRDALAGVLECVPQGMYGTALHTQMARLNMQISAGFVVVRQGTDGFEVRLRKRGDKEYYPGLWAVEANAFLPDEAEGTLLSRMTAKFGCSVVSFKHLKQADFVVEKEERSGANWLMLVYVVELDKEPVSAEGDNREWFSVNDLPQDMVEHHRTGVLLPTLSYLINQADYDAAETAMKNALGL